MTRGPHGAASRQRPADLTARLRHELGEDAVHLSPAARYGGDRAVGSEPGTRFVLVLPRDTDGVRATLRLAHETRTPVVPRGAGSGLSGGATPLDGSIVLGLEHLTRIREIDPLDEVAVVEAGVLTADLSAVLEPHGFFYAPDPASASFSSIGGNIATNAGGLHCAKYGVTRESVLGLVSAAAGVGAITRTPVRPAATELLDAGTLQDIDENTGSRLADGDSAVLLIELDGYGIEEQTRDLTAAMVGASGAARVVEDEAEAARLWELRRSGRSSGAGGLRLGEDVTVPPSRLARMYEEIARIGTEHGIRASAVAHAGDGNLHPALSLPREEDDESGQLPEPIRRAADDLVRTALDLGGTISGEHGIGTAKRGWLDLELSAASRDLQRRIKEVFDPRHLLNPGKAL